MMHRPALFLLALVLLAAPLAQAHVEGFSQSKTVPAGPYTVFLQPRPDVVFANTTLTMAVQVYHSDTGGRARGVSASLLVAGPQEFSKRSDLRDDGTGYLVATVLLPARGNYSARIFVKDANDTYNADTEIEAYPDLSFRIRSSNAEADAFVDKPITLDFDVVNRTTLMPEDRFDDLRIRFEHWSEDHTQLLGHEDVTPTEKAPGRWTIEHTFKARGMYHIRFASDAAGFTYADVPILHLYATAPPNADTEDGPSGRNAPDAGVAALLLGLALVALVRVRRP